VACQNCGFIFPSRPCYDYHLINSAPEELIRSDRRTFASICQMRRICGICHHIIYEQQQHDCLQQQQQNLICNKCHGPHSEDLPCYIQPLNVQEDSESDEENPQQQKQQKKQKRPPIRFCFFDAETSQDENIQITCNINGYIHVPILIIAEVIF